MKHPFHAFIPADILGLAGCAPIPVDDPAAAIRLAATRPDGIRLQVTLEVQSASIGQGRETGIVFLNSEANYQNLNSLNVALSPEVVKGLILDRKIDPIQGFLHHTIRATGQTRRVQIAIVDGPYAGRFYYQTHLDVTSVDDIQLLPSEVQGVQLQQHRTL